MFLIGFISGVAGTFMIEFLAFAVLVLKCYNRKKQKDREGRN